MLTWALRRWRQGRLWKLERAQALGPLGEDLAAEYLRKAGYRIHARNWRPRTGRGEIDVIASEGAVLVFVEVKTRSTDEFGLPERAIGEAKRRLLAAGARAFFRAHAEAPRLYRFDTVGVVWGGPLTAPETAAVELVRDAFYVREIAPAPFAPHISEAVQERASAEWEAAPGVGGALRDTPV